MIGQENLDRRIKEKEENENYIMSKIILDGDPYDRKRFLRNLSSELDLTIRRVNFARYSSKFIDETLINLERIFSRAESKDWILFFDEADALFGKRTNTRDAREKYAKEIAHWLLERLETHEGTVVIATDKREDLSKEFIEKLNIDTIIQAGKWVNKDLVDQVKPFSSSRSKKV